MDTDVLVVGAGPTGLLLAGDLAAAGVRCVVAERHPEPSTLTRAFAVHARTLEQLDARGVADDLVATGQQVTALRLFGRADLDFSRLPSRFRYVLVTPQSQTERVLEGRAQREGADIRRGLQVLTLRQSEDGVDVDVQPSGGIPSTIRAAYAVGADGVHSTVRKTLGLPFPGGSAVRSVMLADVRLTERPPDALTLGTGAGAFALLAPFGDGWYRAIAWNRAHQQPDDAPVDLGEVRETVRQALGRDFGLHDPRWMSRFHSDERQVPRYRSGRVLLAGDAAHVHSPAGGQGMNTGLQDAANLGWKLAATVRGWAPPGLLDSYDTERHRVGRQVVRGSGALLRMALTQPAALRAARDLATDVVTRIPMLADPLATAASGVAIRYPARPGAHLLTGRRLPDVRLADGRRLYEALRDGRFLLVATAGSPVVLGAAADHADRVTAVAVPGTGGPAVLARPDGYIAWAAGGPDTAERAEQARAAIAAWTTPAGPALVGAAATVSHGPLAGRTGPPPPG